MHEQRNYEMLRTATVPSSQVTLSVVIPSFNTADFIVAAVESVLKQTYRHLEVIVVDDDSSDDSIDRLLTINDMRLTCVRQANRGLAGARNTGLLLARGTLVGLLDADDIWFREKAAMHVSAMSEDLNLGVTFSHSAYLDEAGNLTGQLLISSCSRPTVKDLIARNHVGNGSTPVIRRAILESAGLFDESVKSCEEWELWVRMAARTRCGFLLIPAVLTGYRVRSGSLSGSYDHFIEHGELAVEKFREYVPGFSDAQANRAKSQNCRIASRKALSAGQIALSRTLLLRAIQQYPLLVVRDVRAAGLAIIHLISLPFPDSWGVRIYRAVRRLMKAGYSQAVPLPLSVKCRE
jgi:glycosyltransferase involved in cell wall biosynthesis